MEILGLINIPLWAVLLLALTALFYFYSTRHFGVFTAMGVKGPKPWPFLGNFGTKKGFVEVTKEWSTEYGRVFGTFAGPHPALNMGDLDMLKDVTVKEFNNFPNRNTLGIDEVSDPPVSEFLTMLKDDDWRHNRNTLTPTFSGGKLKRMMETIVDCSRELVDALKVKADSGEPTEMKERTGAFILDVIATTSFGLKLDTHKNLNSPFIQHVKKSMIEDVFSLGIFILFFFPFLKPVMRWLKISVFPQDSINFFSDIVKQALVERRNNPGKYKDFLQLMANAEKEAQVAAEKGPQEDNDVTEQDNKETGHWKDKRKGQGLTDTEIMAASIVVFAAGYDTTASTLAYLFYHLAKNPNCMDRLVSEIDQNFPNGKDPDYDSMAKLPYLDMVLSETLRINPPVGAMDRVCKKQTTINGLTIPVGLVVTLPIYMIHHDPGHWPDPETFDPERFTPENRATHHPLQWIPFGYGPRNCIGMRLALLEMKIVIIKLLQKYRFVPNSKTKPLRFGALPLLSRPKDGVWLTVEHRT